MQHAPWTALAEGVGFFLSGFIYNTIIFVNNYKLFSGHEVHLTLIECILWFYYEGHDYIFVACATSSPTTHASTATSATSPGARMSEAKYTFFRTQPKEVSP